MWWSNSDKQAIVGRHNFERDNLYNRTINSMCSEVFKFKENLISLHQHKSYIVINVTANNMLTLTCLSI